MRVKHDLEGGTAEEAQVANLGLVDVLSQFLEDGLLAVMLERSSVVVLL
jgi:hypothetical protein